ncbi:ATP-binding protein [Mycoplasmopsis pullorum]|uniref:ATP-binding protein n=1 Tax=Mycoplasmopsis pullorum TaxID=48003 RepID=UPI001119C34D|nr:ATP-binding protein [Mycoplasmopsis pullorum]TNK87771.1 hypothetical protein C4M89_04115 [Mycoplasmopsis pullorum]TNK91912.1 hypothetical protein C4M96_02925 [Mycoplasmopsis pullorum]
MFKDIVYNYFIYSDYSSVKAHCIHICKEYVTVTSPAEYFHNVEPEEFFTKLPTSKNRNKLIAKIFKNANLIPNDVTGFIKIMQICHNIDLKIDFFKTSDDFSVTIYRDNF